MLTTDGREKVDKGIVSYFKNGSVDLEFGCGAFKREGFVGIDMIDYDDVDIGGNVAEIIPAIPSASCRSIYASHFFCHVLDWQSLLYEAARILDDGGELVIINPHMSNPYAYSDPTHVKFSGLYSLSYYARDEIFRRKVPLYSDVGLRLKSVQLCFKAERPFYLSYALGRVFSAVFNLTPFLSEIYEWIFSKYITCYEIRYVLINGNSTSK